MKTKADCTLCARYLEGLCCQRAWWFRFLRQALVLGVRVFALAYGITCDGQNRSVRCRKCLRFMKNKMKSRSSLFCWLDRHIGPAYNRAQDRLLMPEEMERARALAMEAGKLELEVDTTEQAKIAERREARDWSYG
jgi:hypothetical protein